MFWARIHRMILIDLARVFSLSLIVLTGLILMAGVIAEAMKNGLGPAQMLTVVPLLLPSLSPYTVPTATLFATCVVYGRLSADNEILALKAAGIHLIHILWPALFLGLVTGGATMLLSLHVIPYTHFYLRTRVGGDVDELLYTILKRDGSLRNPKLRFELHATSIQGRTLHGVVFKRMAARGAGYDIIACAKEAELRVDLEQRQILIDVKQCQIIQGGATGTIDKRTLPVDIPDDWNSAGVKVRSMEMTWAELAFYEEKFGDELRQFDQDIERHQKQVERGRGGARLTEHVQHLTNERRVRGNYLHSIGAERHMRPALAISCLCFALVGCPIGIWLSRSDYLVAFVACFLPIVTVYYPLILCMNNLARSDKVAPWLGIHLANVLMLMIGAILFRRLTRQ